jgi:hypothetical protein
MAEADASAGQRHLATVQPPKPVLDHSVAAAMFGGIESCVGSLDQNSSPP